MTVLLLLILFWLVFNWLAPLSLLAFSERISTGRVPRDILDKARAHRVQFYVSTLARSFAFSTWLGWKHAVVIDRAFMQNAYPCQLRFVFAHELGHCALGHLKRRWLCTVTGLALLPWVRAYLERKEEEADEWAEALSGLPKEILTDAEVLKRYI